MVEQVCLSCAVTTGEDKSHTYGVVESMDHFGRTCMVHWMRPYDEGQGDRWVYQR